ncbi:peptide-methionine (S)-S-oxide reductase MsrA [Aureibaculum conchae]|uniref:peptide-methionine (S)-S-oxide reductase MsrA n=1 Tax=Aureibaculum sp. 2308TA14-22 TaxID=3108392 RepID=UPI00339B35CC
MINRSIFLILMLSLFSCNLKAEQEKENPKLTTNKVTMEGKELATFGNGCFWCTEAIFEQLEGVYKVESGYAGGEVKNPTYKEVSTGNTGHAEVIRLRFDPKVITYTELLEVFFSTHDPTTLNRQGADVGTQYRSAIFYHNEEQKKAAENMIAALEKENVFENPIVTEITAINNYSVAENYHQDYYNNNKNQGYCRAVINPKLEKFKKQYKDKLKKG